MESALYASHTLDPKFQSFFTSSTFFCFMLWDSIWTLLNNFDNFFSVLKCDKSFPPVRRILAIDACDARFFASCEFMFSKWFAIRWKCNKLLFSFPRYLFKNFALEICCYLSALLKIIDSFQMLAFEMQKGPTCQNHQTQTCLIISQIW